MMRGDYSAGGGVFGLSTPGAGFFHHILSTGQSNAMGAGALPALTTVAPFPGRSLMLNKIPASDTGQSGIRAPQHRLVAASEYTSLVNLEETDTYDQTFTTDPVTGHYTTLAITSYDGETPGGAMFAQLCNRAYWLRGAFSVFGASASPYASICQGTDSYANGLTQVQAVHSLARAAGLGRSRVLAIVVQHGEADEASATYSADLQTWVSDLATDIRAITGQVEDPYFLLTQVSWATNKTSALQQLAATAADPRIRIVTPVYPIAGVDLHRTAAQQRHTGQYMAKAYWELLNGRSWAPLQPTTAVRAGATITITFSVPVGQLALDTTIVAAQADYGFEYTDSTSSASISSVSVSGSTVTVTLSGVPTGANKRIKYGITASMGNLRDGDASVGYYGDRLYNWCAHFDMAAT